MDARPWFSSTLGDLHRRQMSGGSVFSTSVTSCLPSLMPISSSAYRASSDVISALTRFADTRLYGGVGSSSDWSGDPLNHARMSTDSGDVENRHEAAGAWPRTPAKREQLSPPQDATAERPSTPHDPLHCSGNYTAVLQAPRCNHSGVILSSPATGWRGDVSSRMFACLFIGRVTV